ncbi:MAG: GNAT family N-acetyltransferase [Hyphomicrobiales bacterium]|nr:GNAT family N-acetyltransferase [Hyphomicrobiales bacterium]
MKVQCHEGFDSLPPRHAEFIDRAGRENLFMGRSWAEHLATHDMVPPTHLVIFTAEDDDGRPRLVMPAADIPGTGSWRAPHTLASATHSENFGPLCIPRDPADGDDLGLLTRFFRALRRDGLAYGGGNYHLVRLCPLAKGSTEEATMRTALGRAGFWVQPYANSINAFESTAGIDHATYFAARSSNMRYNLRRRRRNLEKAGQMEIRVLTTEAEVDRAMGDYIQVALASWKDPTTMVDTATADLMHLAARHGCLRMGLLYLDGRALAAQFWIVTGGGAHCVRLAYREDCRAMSPGVVLTDHMIRHVLDHDHADEIGYGYGDDEYKEKWMHDQRQYLGLAAFNPRCRQGLVGGAIQIAGHGAKEALKKALGVERLVPAPEHERVRRLSNTGGPPPDP